MGPVAGTPVRSFHLGRETLASLGSPPGNHPRAADRRHALAEAVPPFAHQPARLIGPFHRLRSIPGRRPQSLAGPHHAPCSSSSHGCRGTPATAPSIELAAYRGAAGASQSQLGLPTSRRPPTRLQQSWHLRRGYRNPVNTVDQCQKINLRHAKLSTIKKAGNGRRCGQCEDVDGRPDGG